MFTKKKSVATCLRGGPGLILVCEDIKHGIMDPFQSNKITPFVILNT